MRISMRTVTRTTRLVAAVAALALAVAACGDVTPSSTPPAASIAVLVATPSATLATPIPSSIPSPAPTASDTPVPSVPPTPTDSPSSTATTTPTPAPTHAPYRGPLVATRVVVPALHIDLAVTRSPKAGVYPYCNVAMYFGKPFGQPGQSRATYLFAHARVGMFYAIYNLTMIKRTPNKMVGMEVDVYTSDSRLHVYKIVRVLPHQLTLNRALAARHDQLWLQTSEGPHGTPGKTQVVAEPVSVSQVAYAASHPKVHIVRCG